MKINNYFYIFEKKSIVTFSDLVMIFYCHLLFMYVISNKSSKFAKKKFFYYIYFLANKIVGVYAKLQRFLDVYNTNRVFFSIQKPKL